MNDIQLKPFSAQDQAEVETLILAGMREHWGELDLTKNQDLHNIQSSYVGATFLIARQNDRVVGCGALVPKGDGIAEIMRMSVAADKRRCGIGGMVLVALLEKAMAIGMQRIILETTVTWQEAIAFYLKHDFRITHYQDGNAYFAIDLGSGNLSNLSAYIR